MTKRRSASERIFSVLIIIFFTIIALAAVLPFMNIIAKSLSSESAVIAGRVGLWPIGFQIGTYKYVIGQAQFLFSFRNSVIITLGGTLLAMLMTCLAAYPLSKIWLGGRKVLMLIFVFVMLFNGGMVPNYLLIKSLGMTNTLWALTIPGLLSVYNMILLKSFFEQIPEGIEESARMDGAHTLTILFRIILPMSLPAIATVGLLYAVSFWNNYMNGVMYITQPHLKPLQQYLYEIVTESQRIQEQISTGGSADIDKLLTNLQPDAIRAATIILASVPIMLVYPFLQKYFVTGLVIGSVKG